MLTLKTQTKQLSPSSAGKKAKQFDISYILWECEMSHSLWKIVWHFLIRLSMNLSYDPEIPLLAIYPREMET
jgi:hypothetical protein